MTSARTITASANPPRSVFVDVPLGHTAGPPNDERMQRHIVHRALELGAAMTTPGTVVDLDLRWHHDDWKAEPLGWTRRSDGRTPSDDVGGGDSRTARSDEPQYQSDDDRRAAGRTDMVIHCRACIGLPQTQPDEWGDVEFSADVAHRELSQRLDREEADAGHEPW